MDLILCMIEIISTVFLVKVTFYYTIFDKILKILCIFDIFKHARSVPLVHSIKNQALYIMQ